MRSLPLWILAAGMSASSTAAPDDREPDSRVDVSPTLTLAPFGASGTSHLAVVGTAAFALEDDDSSTDLGLSFAYHHFLIEDVEFIGELGGWHFAQDGDDQWGVNPSMSIRWHFLNRQRWTVFADMGIGVLFATGEVPDGGTSINFMPRAGGGATFRLDDRGTRMIVGARWHHISNARFSGDSDNPDRDGVAFYGGVMWPF